MLDDLYRLSDNHRVLLVFLRHLGCTLNFVIAQELKNIVLKDEKIQIFCFYPNTSVSSKTLEEVFGFPKDKINFIPDPEKVYYKYFSISDGTYLQFLRGSLKLLRKIPFYIKNMTKFLKLERKGFLQMPGFVLLHKRQAKPYIPSDIADVPKLDQFLCLEAAND